MLEFVSHDKCNRVLMECHSSEKCIGCSLSIASKLLHCDGSEARRRRWRVARRRGSARRGAEYRIGTIIEAAAGCRVEIV